MTLGLGFAFGELYDREGLARLDRAFMEHLAGVDPARAEALARARANPSALNAKDEGDLLIELGPAVEDFLGRLFDVERELAELAARTHGLEPLFACKRLFVQRRALREHAQSDLSDARAIEAALQDVMPGKFNENEFARRVMAWSLDEAAHGDVLAVASRYAAWATLSEAGRRKHARGVLFKQPRKIDPMHLIATKEVDHHGVPAIVLAGHARERDGFALTDRGMDDVHALDHMHYCIFCHNQGKDSCSKGLRDRKSGAFQKSAFGVTLAGCPLEEKISEMHTLRTQGHALAALAVIVVDNPMVAATGHRICNDCMKACIYQKQEPVDIPQAETRILKDVLALPWGFEIYSLLTRWNPLNLRRPLPRAASGNKVLVVGLGPAGFTLAHHLMNDGHAVAAIDGLKIEPLAEDISGVSATGERVAFTPVRDIAAIEENLDDRVMAGFGGVAEYGITVRWNKNYLKIIRLLLERRREFAMFGGVRFGGTITTEDAWALGFDHIALCLGAGKPTQIAMPNGLARGVRMASDFLMALQLTGAAKKSSIANLQLRLPVVVIGGGLTAIDTATEALAYYVRQVEKFRARHRALVAERGEAAIRAAWSEEEAAIAGEFLAHGEAIAAERAAASREDRQPRLGALLSSWGGAVIAYRRRMIDSPSYTLNHEEVEKALEEGVRFAENLTPLAVELDRFGHASALRVSRRSGDATSEARIPARAILIAAGTQPNTVLAREEPETYALDGKYFVALAPDGARVKPEHAMAKPSATHVLTRLREDGRAISYLGDLHPSFFGNVVKAMGSARRAYPEISATLARRSPTTVAAASLFDRLNAMLRARVHAVRRLTPTIVEVVVHAPQAARNFRPGQFFRLQNYERFAPRDDGTIMAMEGLAMTGAWVDVERGLVSVVVLEMGGSSDVCAWLRPGEPVILMGPTGEPTEIAAKETVLLVGGGLGNAVLFSIGAAFRKRGSRVLYFAGYKRMVDRYMVPEIEAAADVVVWCCDEAPGFTPGRARDKAVVANIVEAMARYGEGALGERPIALGDVDRVIAIGSDRMMQAVARARHARLKPFLKAGHAAIGSINSPMQCMMKEVCAQCLQPHRDPVTGAESVVFSCFNQDQKLDEVDFAALHERLGQNTVHEKLTARWIDRGLRRLDLRRAAE